jgi:hypothetical protein
MRWCGGRGRNGRDARDAQSRTLVGRELAGVDERDLRSAVEQDRDIALRAGLKGRDGRHRDDGAHRGRERRSVQRLDGEVELAERLVVDLGAGLTERVDTGDAEPSRVLGLLHGLW